MFFFVFAVCTYFTFSLQASRAAGGHLYASAVCSIVGIERVCLHFFRILILDSVNAYTASLKSKIKNVLGNSLKDTAPVLSESETYSKRVGVLKVTPKPQMPLTTILIKGDRYGENRIL